MKPIFKEEQLFFEEKTNIKLPDNCWRSGTKIYLNCKDEVPVMKFKVENKQILITKNIIKNINGKFVEVEYLKNKKLINEIWESKTLEEEYLENEEIILIKENESITITTQYILDHDGYEVRESDSGGKDSTLLKVIVKKVFKRLGRNDYVVDFFNTSNDTADTYRQVKLSNDKEKLQVHNPKIGMMQWIIKVKNYYLPSVNVRNCCSTYKEGKLKDVLNKKSKYIMLLGMRKYESSKRANYDWDLNEAIKKQNKVKLNVPENWKRFLPIVEWKDEEVWLYLIHNNIPYNPMYNLGFNRCGCLVCPYQSDYIDLLIEKYYPTIWKRWMDVIVKNYELYDVKNRLKWTIEEWINGKWKQGTSKEQDIIQNNPTPERIKELAEIKGISEELAAKYFRKVCSCGKKLNPDEVAINLKFYGRGMDVEKVQCKKCFCEANNITGKEYQDYVHNFRNEGCNLF